MPPDHTETFLPQASPRAVTANLLDGSFKKQVEVLAHTKLLTVLGHLWRKDRLSLSTHN